MADTVREVFLNAQNTVRLRAAAIVRTYRRCQDLNGPAETRCRRQLRLLIFLGVADAVQAVRSVVGSATSY